MAAIFDGSTSDMTAIDSAVAIDYPVVLACYYKADDALHRGTLVALSDNGAGGSLDGLALEIRGDAGGDRIDRPQIKRPTRTKNATLACRLWWRLAARGRLFDP